MVVGGWLLISMLNNVNAPLVSLYCLVTPLWSLGSSSLGYICSCLSPFHWVSHISSVQIPWTTDCRGITLLSEVTSLMHAFPRKLSHHKAASSTSIKRKKALARRLDKILVWEKMFFIFYVSHIQIVSTHVFKSFKCRYQRLSYSPESHCCCSVLVLYLLH